ncbi:putative virion structural protein [Stenotrophomonas phage vB_Sm_QDWS359]|uniref:Virion structural protein n=1 Tax=Stenotrophomonas phage vB_Sm_QDWS359 TaxID=2943841 RepID=A0A9E7DKT0_9CAUD|nr:putative virion structural protein [Stenotrophomonas phage vB_Sm_QDWS359]UQM93924.1 putative virion structural protein [Stenotrophomonas phage vB_Sm_QDWS359]
MGSSKKQTVGYKYYLGMHMILCHGPIDSISRISVDNKVAWSGTTTGGQISVNAPSLFGGDEREGGVSGLVDIEMGRTTQGRNSYLQTMLGAAIPAFRGVVGAVLRQCYLGNNPYLKLWAFRGKRIHVRQDGLTQWYDAKSEVGGDMNPAHIIREVLTDPDWGMGYPEADMDETAFAAAADALFTEGMGMSLLWDKQQGLDDFLAIVLRHIDASLYTDRLTGRFVLKLARGGYDVASLPLLDESNVQRVTDFKRATVDELTNQVSVTFWDKSTGKDNSVTVQDIALAATQGATIGTTVQYPGFTNGTIATKVAARDLKALSTPLATATIYATRAAANLNIGDVFRFHWEEYGVEQVVFRVTNIELGDLTSNLVKLSVIEDVFALSSAIYAPPPPSEWVDPIGPPTPVQYRLLTEVPYYMLARQLGDSQAAALPYTATYMMVAGAKPSGGAISAQVMVDEGAGYIQQSVMSFAPTATVTAAVAAAETSTIPITGGVDLDLVQPGDLAVLGTGATNALEFVRVVSITDTQVVVNRGMLDTTPRITIAAGVRILFLGQGDYVGEIPIEYSLSETVSARLLTTTGQGTLALGSAATDALSVTAQSGRQDRPNPPGRLRISAGTESSLVYPAEAYGPTVTATWAHRDRIQMTAATPVLQDASNIGPEAGTTYTCRWYLDGSLVRTQTGIAGVTDSYDPPVGSGGKTIRVEVDSVRDGIVSLMPLTHQFLYRAQLVTEAGDRIVTEEGDPIILE